MVPTALYEADPVATFEDVAEARKRGDAATSGESVCSFGVLSPSPSP